MAKLLTGTRIYGTGTVDTQLFVSGTNSATSTTTGALQVVGGVGVGGNLYVGGTIFGGTLSGTASTATNSDNVKTVSQTTNASYYPAFVDSNNSTAAYEALYTTSSFVINPQSGNVGVGESDPLRKFVVRSDSSGSITAIGIYNGSTATSNESVISFRSDTTGTGAATFQEFAGFSTTYTDKNHATRSADFNIFTANAGTVATRLVVKSTGNVGIGNANPSAFSGFTSNRTVLQITNPTSDSGQIILGGGVNALLLDYDNAAGNVTIRNTYGASAAGALINIDSGTLVFRTGTSYTERLRVTANGGISFGASGTAYGVSGQILQSNGDAAPTWISTGSLAAANATTATHLSGGVAGQIPYQTAPGVTAFLSTGTAGDVLVSNGSGAATYNNTLRLAGATNATSTSSGALQVVGGVGVGGDLFIQGDIRTNDTLFNLINGNATTVNFAGDATTLTMGASGSGTTNVRNNLTVSGNLTVQGTTTIVDSTVTNIADPIITLGGGTGNSAPTADDNKDRGVAFKWVNNGGTTSTGFFGYDDSTGYFTYVQTATITNEVVSGTKGAMDVNLAGGTAMSIHYQSSPDNTAFLAATTSGYLLQTNGTGSAPSWVSASGVSAGSATYADNVRTIAQTSNAAHFLTFVDSNNASNTYESLYTTSSFSINPATGNVGIGTSTATYALTIVNSSPVLSVGNLANTGGSIYLGNSNHGVNRGGASGSNDVSLYTTAGNLYLSANGLATTSHLTVSNAGNVNIGTFTSSIAKKFTVVGEGNFSDASNTTRLYMGFGTIPTTGGTGAYIYNNDNTPLAFGTTNTERMRIDTLGTVGIGETTPATYATTGSLVITNTTFRPEIALRTTTAIGGTTAIKLGATSSIPQGGAVISSYISAVSGQPTDLIFSLVTSGVLTERLRITSNGGIAFSGTNTYGTSGFVLKSNGDAAPTWVNASTLASGSATNADNIRTVAQTANATYYPAFVDSHNASAAYESLYTSGIFTINPNTGFVGIGSQDGASPLNVKVISTLSGTINSFQKVLTTQAAGGLGNNVYRSEWRRRRAAGTDWTTQNIFDGIWVDGSFTTPGTDTRTWWDRDPNTPSQAWGDQATTWMFHNSSALFLTGGSSQLNTGFTNRLNVSGAIVAGSASSTNGSIILQGQYGTGSITNFGTEYSSGGPVISYGVYPSNAGTGAFFSSSGAALTRAAYTQAGNVHNWYVGASQTVAIGSAATLALAMTLNSTGALAFNGASNYGTSGQLLKSNGNTSPTWVDQSTVVSGQVSTVLQTASASYFPTFVDSNNAAAAAESFYTTSSFVINPATGRVGIGTSSPSTNLTIGGTAASGGASGGLGAFLSRGVTTNFYEAFDGTKSYIAGVDDTQSFAKAGTLSGHDLAIITGNGSKIYIQNSTGNVGIGTTNPPNKLTVSNSGAVGLEISPTGGYTALGGVDLLAYNRSTSAYAPIGFVTNGSNNSMVILTSGNVGIGTTTPNDKLQVQTSSATAYDATTDTGQYGGGAGITVTNMDETSQSFAQINLQVSGNSGRAVGRIVAIRTASATSDLAFVTENANTKAEKMRIFSNGNVSIGTTSTTNKFEVAGTAGQLFSVSDSFTGTIFSANDVSGIPSIEVLDTGLVKLAQYNGAVAIGTGTITSSTAELSVYGMLYTLGSQGEIRASSEITAYFSSDQRLKENIKLIENPITIIDQIRGVTFDWTDEHMARRGGEDGYFVRKHDIGVIAQEVQAVLPELVGTREDGYLAVKYEKMVPLLIEAIKAQQKTIDSLVKDLDDVKEFVNTLKNKNGI